jgi:Gpi18-like mannosyltransferase
VRGYSPDLPVRRPAPGAGHAAATGPAGWWAALRFCVAVFAVACAGWALLSVIGVGLVSPGRPVSVPGLPAAPLRPGWANLLTGGYRQDALWYLRIALHGYRPGDGSAAFFPLYPLAIRLVAFLPGVGPLAAATLVAWAGYLAGLVVVYRLTEFEFDTQVARVTVLAIAAFPTAFFFLSPYTEGPFLALSAGAFYAARRSRWAWAGSLAALAGLTRSVGLLLIAGLAVEALLQWRAGGRRLAPGLLAAAGPAVGFGAYTAFWWLRFADPMAPYQAQRNWQRSLAWPSVTLWHAALDAYRYTSYWLIDAAVVVVVLLAVLAGLRSLRPSYLIYAVASLLLPLSDPFPSRPLMSMPRFVLVIFPAFWVIARGVLRHRLPSAAVVGPFAAGFALLGLLFMNWLPIF